MKMLSKRLLLFAALLLQSAKCVRGATKVEVTSTGEDLMAEAVVAAEDTALMGKMFPLASKLFVRRKCGLSFQQVFRAVANHLFDGREFIVLAASGWGLVPATKSIYEMYANVTGRGLGYEEEEELVEEATKSKVSWKNWNNRFQEMKGNEQSTSSAVAGRKKRKMVPFRDTVLFQVVEHVSQASKIGLAVIAVDCMSLASKMMGYNPWNIMESASRIFSKFIYTGWITLRFSLLKRYFLRKAVGKFQGSDLGKMKVVDNLADGVLYLIWMFYLLNLLEVQTGIAVKSLFSVGATGTLIFGLASKDIASEIIGGLVLHISDGIFEGDTVRFSDGTSGKIEKMGWFETYIRNTDELVAGIPNTQLSRQRVHNLSRTPRSQVKQELRISYDDAPKIPKLLENIKDEIRKDCPKLITDGSRPFRAHWRNYEDDHLQVVVDCHFMIKPTGNEYWDNRQKVLEAIHRAAKKTGVHFEKLVRAVKV